MLPIPMLSLDPRSLKFNTLAKPFGPIKMVYLDEPLTLQLPDALRIMYSLQEPPNNSRGVPVLRGDGAGGGGGGRGQRQRVCPDRQRFRMKKWGLKELDQPKSPQLCEMESGVIGLVLAIVTLVLDILHTVHGSRRRRRSLAAPRGAALPHDLFIDRVGVAAATRLDNDPPLDPSPRGRSLWGSHHHRRDGPVLPALPAVLPERLRGRVERLARWLSPWGFIGLGLVLGSFWLGHRL
jgi:hypothetical protein